MPKKLYKSNMSRSAITIGLSFSNPNCLGLGHLTAVNDAGKYKIAIKVKIFMARVSSTVFSASIAVSFVSSLIVELSRKAMAFPI